jgi:hypothetical protein
MDERHQMPIIETLKCQTQDQCSPKARPAATFTIPGKLLHSADYP